jgi:hypothetical protein
MRRFLTNIFRYFKKSAEDGAQYFQVREDQLDNDVIAERKAVDASKNSLNAEMDMVLIDHLRKQFVTWDGPPWRKTNVKVTMAVKDVSLIYQAFHSFII